MTPETPEKAKAPKAPNAPGTGPAEGDGYTGRVEPGGPPDVRELPALTIRKMAVSAMHNNVYLLTCAASGEQLLIDAADEPDRILELVAATGAGRRTGRPG